MSKTNSIIFRVVGLLVIIGLLAGGAFAAYRFGFSQGVTQSPAIAEAMQSWEKSAPSAAVPFAFGAPMMRGFGYYPHMYGGPMGFFIVGKVLVFIFFTLLFIGMLRFAFRPPWSHHPHWHGECTPPWAQAQPKPQEPPQPEATSNQKP